MPETEPVHGYNHSLSPSEIVSRVINFNEDANDMCFEEVLDCWVEQSEQSCERAQREGAPMEELEAENNRRKNLRGEAKQMFAELYAASDGIAQGRYHAHLVLCAQKYKKGIVEFTIPSAFLWAKASHGRVIAEWGPPTYTDGQKLFLSIAWLSDSLLTGHNGDWRSINCDPTDKTTIGLMINGRPYLVAVADRIAGELPVDVDGRDPGKTIKNIIKLVLRYLTVNGEPIVDLSSKAQTMGYRTLYGLARAVWKAKKGCTMPDPEKVQYPGPDSDSDPEKFYAALPECLTEYTPITQEDLTSCLQEAARVTRRLYAPDGR